MGDLMLIAVAILFYGSLFLIHLWGKYNKKWKEQKEFNNWLNHTEPLFRDGPSYPEDWWMRRKYVAKKAKYTCQECGKKGWLGFHVHHITPLSKGGNNTLDNLIYLCRWCHENHHEHMKEARIKRYVLKKRFRNAVYWKRR
jgi:5-methylcytosine-specific restriction endonuclease McrA